MFFWVAKQNSFVFYVKDFGVDILLCWLYKSWLKDLKKGGGGVLKWTNCFAFDRNVENVGFEFLKDLFWDGFLGKVSKVIYLFWSYWVKWAGY